MTQKTPESPSEPDKPELRQERLVHGADEMMESINAANPEERAQLIQAAADKFEKQGLIIIDLHDAHKALEEFDHDSLPGKKGKKSGLTRAQLLGAISITSQRPRRRRR
jgi:hypothetical protein